VVTSVTAFLFYDLLPTAANAEWKQNNSGWWYNTFSSPYYAMGWKKVDNKMYKN